MSTPVIVPAAVAPESHNGHVDRIKVGRLEADTVVIGNVQSDGRWLQTSATLTGGALGTAPVNIVRYTVVGKTCFATYLVRHLGGAGTATAALTLSLPVPPANISASGSTPACGAGFLGTTTGFFQITPFIEAGVLLLLALANASGPEVLSQASTAGNRLTQADWRLELNVIYETA